LTVGLVADEQDVWVTGHVEASKPFENFNYDQGVILSDANLVSNIFRFSLRQG
jgi:hypothetical protein